MSWKNVPLGQLCEVLDNKRKPITKKDRVSGDFPYYGATGIVDYVAGYIFAEKLVLIGEDGAKWSSGDKTAFIADGKYWVNNHAHVIKPNRDAVLDEWLVYYFCYKDLTDFVTGLTVPKLNQGQLISIPVPLPPLATQQKIVEKLDAIFAEIDKATAAAEANIKNAEALFQSYLDEIFNSKNKNWITATLKDICEKITDGTHQTPTYFDDGVIFLSSKNVTSGKIDWDRVKYIDSKQHLEMSKRVSPKFGDVLLAKNGTTGVAAIVDRDVVFDIYVSLALLRAKEQVLPQFLLYFVNSPVAKKQFNSRLKGIGVPNLHLQEIREVAISFPKSLDEQRKLVKQIESFWNTTTLQGVRYTNKKNEIDKLKKSILKQAFSGELVKE